MKRFNTLVLIFLTVCILMTSCYTTQRVQMSNADVYEVLSQYTDLTKTGIIKYLGPPTREVSDGGNGTILVYEYNSGSTTVATTQQNNTYYNTRTRDKYTWVYLDSKDHCTQVKSNDYYEIKKNYDPGMTTGVVLSSILAGLGLFALIMLAKIS